MKTLVIGLPATGKTTYCKQNLGADGLCYDLDAIAAAFRLKQPHEEKHMASTMMANELLFAFYTHVNRYANNVFIIRSAPSIDEFKRIAPNRVVICRHKYGDRRATNEAELLRKIEAVEQHCIRNNIPVDIQEEQKFVMPVFKKR